MGSITVIMPSCHHAIHTEEVVHTSSIVSTSTWSNSLKYAGFNAYFICHQVWVIEKAQSYIIIITKLLLFIFKYTTGMLVTSGYSVATGMLRIIVGWSLRVHSCMSVYKLICKNVLIRQSQIVILITNLILILIKVGLLPTLPTQFPYLWVRPQRKY